ncbi:DUF1684 domain-containing protein [Flavitalea sp.]|nr:DUF1684 domain-containing protein [Flavitalea sp.]
MNRFSLCLIFIISFIKVFSQKGDDNLKYITELKEHQQDYKVELAGIIKKDTSFVSFYDVQSAYRLEAVYEPLRNQPVFSMGTSSGKTKQAQKIGLVKFSINNRTYQLSAYQLLALRTNPDQQDLFFIPFTDATSGEETYATGRYLDFKLSDIKNGSSLVIDFNKAYNPYCAFVDGYNCPIPPPENQLQAHIKAGEKAYGKKWK